VQEKIDRTCIECGKVQSFVWKEISRWMRNNRGRALDDYLCNICAIKKRQTRHGDSGTPLYIHWKSMFVRTKGQGHKNNVKYYVEKGIRVCPEWYAYPAFKAWALKNGFEHNRRLELDRINGWGNYGPDNCQWLTKTEHRKKAEQ
jgi:hypothetical protein